MFVELRQGHDGPALGDAGGVGAFGEDGLGFLFGEFDLVADDFHDAAFGAIDGGGGDDGEADLGVARAADHLDDLVELHIDGIHRLGGTLGHGDDAVVGLDLFAHVRRAAGDDAADAGVAILKLEDGADATEGELDVVDVEVGGLDGTHVVGVRIVAVRERGEVGFENLGGVVFLHGLEEARVAFGDDLEALLGDFGLVGDGLVLGEAVGEQLELQAGTPELFGLGLVLGPGEFVADGEVFLVGGEVEFFLEDFLHQFVALLEAHEIDREDVEGRGGVAGAHQLVDRLAVALGEAIDVGL